MSNVISLSVAKQSPLQKFEDQLATLEGSYILARLLEIVRTFLDIAKEKLSPEGMCVLNGDFQMFGGSSCITFICEEGALFPTPVPGVPFMTLEQIIEYPYDYEAIQDPAEFEQLGKDYMEWYRSFNDDEASAAFALLGLFLWQAMLQCGCAFIDAGTQKSNQWDYDNYIIICQNLDLKFVIQVDYYRLSEYFALLRRHAVAQNHSFPV